MQKIPCLVSSLHFPRPIERTSQGRGEREHSERLYSCIFLKRISSAATGPHIRRWWSNLLAAGSVEPVCYFLQGPSVRGILVESVRLVNRRLLGVAYVTRNQGVI